ncbi:SH3 domain-containing protein [Helicobacter bilis]|uniref:SH3 domain-containing protein n=1 Tax=Helicobacter bilis TaxID=37372 RepID=UPI0034C62BC4
MLIQPTHNSTELFVITNPTKLEAIDKKNDYYKVNIDSKVGWISRNDTNKR